MSNKEFFRPEKIDELIGVEHIKEIIKYDFEGSKLLNQNIPSYCISGPPGSGKSTIAGIISNMTGGAIHKLIGSELKKDSDIYNLAISVKDNDVVFIEEAHSVGKNSQMILLEWIENFKLLGGGNGGVDAPKVSFIFPTTNLGKLSKPLRERCKVLQTYYYKVSEIESILMQAASKIGIDLSTDLEALHVLAKCSRGTPRVAISHRLDMLRKVMVVDKLPYNLSTVLSTLNISKINAWGLEHNDIRYCETLYNKMVANKNRPVSKQIIQQVCGIDEDMLDNVIEPYLQQIGAVVVAQNGRSITPLGCEIIDEEVISPATSSNLIIQSMSFNQGKKNIDLKVLEPLLADKLFCSQGMRAVATKFGLSYGQDNYLIKQALHELGYTVKKKAGIIPQE